MDNDIDAQDVLHFLFFVLGACVACKLIFRSCTKMAVKCFVNSNRTIQCLLSKLKPNKASKGFQVQLTMGCVITVIGARHSTDKWSRPIV
jgi:hypothetical protein